MHSSKTNENIDNTWASKQMRCSD